MFVANQQQTLTHCCANASATSTNQLVHSTVIEQESCSPYIVVLDGFEILVKLINQGHTGGNFKAGDVLI